MATVIGMGAKKKASEKENKEIKTLKAEIAKLEEKVKETEEANATLVSENNDLKAEIAKLKTK